MKKLYFILISCLVSYYAVGQKYDRQRLELSLSGIGLLPLGNLAFVDKAVIGENKARSGGYGLNVSYRFGKYGAVQMNVAHTFLHQKYYDVNNGNTLGITTRNILRFTPGFYLTYPVKWFEPRLDIGFTGGVFFNSNSFYLNNDRLLKTINPSHVYGFRTGISLYFYPTHLMSLFAGAHFNYTASRLYKYYWQSDYEDGKKINTERKGWVSSSPNDPFLPYNFANPFSNMEVSVGISFRIYQRKKKE